jgi:hypothetical protein
MHASRPIRRPSRGAHRLAGFLLLTTLAAPAAAAAQTDAPGAGDPSHTRGLFLHLRTGGYGIAFHDDRDGTGTGGGVRIGYGLSERVTLFAGFEGGTISEGDGFEGLPEDDDYGLLHLDVGARVHFRTNQRLVPFLEGGFDVVGVWFDDTQDREATYGGASAALGGGLLWFASPRVALETSALFNAGALMEAEIGGVDQDADLGLAGVRLQVGVSYYPGG